MFSSEASVQSARSSLRNSNPRRRQRTSDGQQQQQPLRKRSKLSNETFVDKEAAYVNGNGSALMNGHAANGDAEKSLAVVDMPVREKKVPPKRAVKEDNTLYLVGQYRGSWKSPMLTTVPSRPRTRTTASRKCPAFPPSCANPPVRRNAILAGDNELTYR
jgi:nuclear pore complex protein Nup133